MRFIGKFDNYRPLNFRLSLAEIEALISELSNEEVADIKFAQEQVRNFAKAQRDSMLDIEVETLPGVILGHKNIPVQSVGCYVPGGKFQWLHPHICPCTSKRGGCPTHHCLYPAFQGRPTAVIVNASGGAHEIYVLGGIQAVGAILSGQASTVHMLVGPGNAFVAEAKDNCSDGRN